MFTDTNAKRSPIWAGGMGVLALCLLAIAAGCTSSPTEGPAVLDTPVPTATHTLEPPWPATWTPVPSRTPTPTVTPELPPGSEPGSSAPGGSAPGPKGTVVVTTLDFDFWINNVWCPGHGYKASFTITGKGGDGVYTYYRDIDQIGGPMEGALTYELHWQACGGAPGTFYVESAGQRVAKKFWVERPDCCPSPLTPQADTE
jgi:hypothetical protein